MNPSGSPENVKWNELFGEIKKRRRGKPVASWMVIFLGVIPILIPGQQRQQVEYSFPLGAWWVGGCGDGGFPFIPSKRIRGSNRRSVAINKNRHMKTQKRVGKLID